MREERRSVQEWFPRAVDRCFTAVLFYNYFYPALQSEARYFTILN